MPARSPVPCAVTIHDCTFFDHPEWHLRSKAAFFRRAIRRAARHAGVLICVSQVTADRLRALVRRPGARRGGAARRRPRALHAARAGRGRRPRRARRAGRAGRPAAGRLRGHARAPQGRGPARRRLRPGGRRHPDAVLVLGGQTGWGMAETERALAAARHPERIVRTGYLPDEAVPALLRQAAVVAYPALEEGFGLPALEALACGAPLVTTEGTAMAEMAGGAALLVPPGDVAALAAALATALEEGPRPRPAGRSGSRWRRSGPGRPASRSTCRPMRSPGRPRSRVPRMRALITGGKGFVGQWLAAHLKDRGDDVAVIDIETDVADGAAVRRVMADVAPEAVYHLAAMTHVGESWENPSQVLRVNVLGTAEILAAARSIGGQPARPGGQLGRGLRGRHARRSSRWARTPPRRRPAPTRPASWRRRRWRCRPGAATASRSSSCGPSTTSGRGSRPTSSCRRWPSGSWRPAGAGPARCRWAL